MKKLAAVLTALSVAAAAVGLAFAAEPNAKKGRYLYRTKYCRTCHGKTASDLSPASKTQAEWKKALAGWQKLPCAKDWKDVSAEDRADIQAYVVEGAKDSPNPTKCN